MAALSKERITTFMRGISLRQVRLASGVVLFAYLVSHFLNHALGNISLEALAVGVYWHVAFWQFLPVTILFYTACVVHTALGIWALYERRQFRWKAIEPLQLVLGLSVPMLIIGHVIGIRLGQTLFGHERLYPQVLFLYWIWAPYRIWLMLAVMTIAWVHGCIGLYFWLRMRAFYKRAAPFLLATAVLIPTLSMLGFYQSGRMVIDTDSMEWRAETQSESQIGTRAEAQALERITDYFLYGYFGLIGIALLARAARAINERRRGMINLSYGNGRTVRVPRGLSVLEASLRNNVPHASVCGGRARCSTCRIRIIGDHSDLPEPSQREAFVLGRVGTPDPSIRLACQLRPTCDISFFQLFLPHTMSADGHEFEPDADRPGALSRQHVRRHARLDQDGGKAPAVRHRLHRQPIPRRGVAGGARERRHAEPVRRRRHAGAVRTVDHPAGSLPPGVARGGDDRRQCRRTEQISRA